MTNYADAVTHEAEVQRKAREHGEVWCAKQRKAYLAAMSGVPATLDFVQTASRTVLYYEVQGQDVVNVGELWN